MPKRRSHAVQLPSRATSTVGRIRLSDIDKKIRITGSKTSQTMKSKKAYDRNKRKRADRHGGLDS